jgi:hypothetical protein
MDVLTVFGEWEKVKEPEKKLEKRKKDQLSFDFVTEAKVKTVTGQVVTQKSLF